VDNSLETYYVIYFNEDETTLREFYFKYLIAPTKEKIIELIEPFVPDTKPYLERIMELKINIIITK